MSQDTEVVNSTVDSWRNFTHGNIWNTQHIFTMEQSPLWEIYSRSASQKLTACYGTWSFIISFTGHYPEPYESNAYPHAISL